MRTHQKEYHKLYLELTNRCNLNCSFCVKSKRQASDLDVDIVKKISKELKDDFKVKEIALHVLGEPLLYKNLNEVFDTLFQDGHSVYLTTNATMLLTTQMKILKHPVIKQINVSMHGLLEEKQIWDANKLKIISYLKEIKDARDDLFINYRFWRGAGKEEEEAIEFLKNEYQVKEHLLAKDRIKLHSKTFLHFHSPFIWPKTDAKGNCSGKCLGLIKQFGILSNGDVVPCCLDYNGEIVLGNVKGNFLKDILETPLAKQIREGFLKGERIANLCKSCSFYGNN